MALMDMLEQAQGGALFAATGKALGIEASEVKQAMAAVCPAIAAKLRDKAAADAGTYDTLLDLLDDNGGEASLDDWRALTGPEAVADGNAVLDEIYGTRNAAITAMRALAPEIAEAQLPKLAAVSATAVLTALAQGRQTATPLAGAEGLAGGGLLGSIVSAVVKGMVQGAARSLAPKRRRRRSYSSYFGRRTRRKSTRRRTRRTPLEEIFGDILGTRR